MAALQVGAELIFGDRPKSETFLQVAKQCSLMDLDTGFGDQVPPFNFLVLSVLI